MAKDDQARIADALEKIATIIEEVYKPQIELMKRRTQQADTPAAQRPEVAPRRAVRP